VDKNNPFHNPDTNEWSDVDVRLLNVKFGVNQKYKDSNGDLVVCLIYDMENDEGGIRDDQVVSIGSGHKAVEGGQAVVHQKAKYNRADNGATLGFSKGSKAAVLLDSLVACDVDACIERGAKTGGPRTAEFWEGLTMHLVEEVVEWGKPDENGNKKTYRQPKATKLYGWGVDFPEDGEEADTASAAAVSPPATAADFGLSDDLYGQLLTLAQGCTTYEDFIAAAYELPEIGDEAVQKAVDDDKSGIWSQV
jgi:hypothetical protein